MAILNGNDDLEVIAWQSNANAQHRAVGQLVRRPAGWIGHVWPNLAVAGISNNCFVTAEINGARFLELTLFQVNSNGSVMLLGNAETSQKVNPQYRGYRRTSYRPPPNPPISVW